MKKLSLLLFICLTIASCSKDENTREEEEARLDKMYKEIVDYSEINSKSCTNPDEWAFMMFGSSNCTGYIVYNKSINFSVFQKKIDEYINARGKYDAKWGIFYGCVSVPPPADIKCIDGKATLTYSNVPN